MTSTNLTNGRTREKGRKTPPIKTREEERVTKGAGRKEDTELGKE